MKGHSERVPNKNIRPLGGRPLYRWIVDTLLDVPAVTTIAIDTDSQKIAEDIQGNYPSVRIIWRPHELRGNFVPMHDILSYDVDQVDEKVYLQTHSTNPLLQAETVSAAIDAFLGSPAHDSLFTVTELQTRLYWKDGRPVNHDPAVLLRTQDLPPVLEENSCLYLFTQGVMDATGQRVGQRPQLFPIPREQAVDIDEEFDFVVADCLVGRRAQAGSDG